MIDEPPPRSHRLEDLGRIREITSDILRETSVFEDTESKHCIESFIKRYRKKRQRENLHYALRHLKEKLDQIHYIAIGGNYE